MFCQNVSKKFYFKTDSNNDSNNENEDNFRLSLIKKRWANIYNISESEIKLIEEINDLLLCYMMLKNFILKIHEFTSKQ